VGAIVNPGLIDRAGLRTYAEALPAGFPIMLPKEIVLALLDRVGADSPAPPQSTVPDRLLSAEEAAKRLGMSREWVYKNAERLPFALRIGTRTMRFSERGIARWQGRQRA
jgi:predicted DNA-binding transcriptional regulator AlpA